jgi:hypothetical protein
MNMKIRRLSGLPGYAKLLRIPAWAGMTVVNPSE